MSECFKCESERILRVSGKCSDLVSVEMDDREYGGYVPEDVGIGGGDYIEFSYCLDCGQIQDSFPVDDPEEFNEEDEDW